MNEPPELLTSTPAQTPGHAAVLVNSGFGTFGKAASFEAGDRPTAAIMHDLNQNGAIDLLVTNPDEDTMTVAFGNGDGSFGTQRAFAVGDRPASLITSTS